MDYCPLCGLDYLDCFCDDYDDFDTLEDDLELQEAIDYEFGLGTRVIGGEWY